VRVAADAAVRELVWKKPYHVDADHIRLETVDSFIASSDFYTIDVADSIGKPPEGKSVQVFLERHGELRRNDRNTRHRSTFSDHARRGRAHMLRSTCSPCNRPARFTATSLRSAGRTIRSSQKSQWTRPTVRRRRPNC